MKKVLGQFIKFGLVGFLCFMIDFAISTVIFKVLTETTGFAYSDAVGSAFGFSVSVIVNYYLSMKYVFVRRDDMDRKKEFTIFLILSILGGLLNTFVVWIFNHPVYENWTWLTTTFSDTIIFMGSKIVATAIVTVYNFISRKLTLEQKEEKKAVA